jgi:hypothetical protein
MLTDFIRRILIGRSHGGSQFGLGMVGRKLMCWDEKSKSLRLVSGLPQVTNGESPIAARWVRLAHSVVGSEVE